MGAARVRSIFAKSLADSRRSILLAAVGFGAMVLVSAWSVQVYYPTLASREVQLASVRQIQGFSPIYGPAIDVLHLGGLVSWNDSWLITLMFGLWSIVALSGTLVGEARSGSLDMLAALPVSRSRIAIEKIGAHLAALAIVAVAVATSAWLAGVLFATLPGDGIAFSDSLAEAATLALLGLAAGSIGFALAPLLGRSLAAGIAAASLFAAFFVTSYSSVVPTLAAIEQLSWLSWAQYNRPLAGSWAPGGLIAVSVLVLAMLSAGVIAFERRDLGSTIPVPRLELPGSRLLLGGPARLSHLLYRGRMLAAGLAVGVGMGAFGLAGKSIAADNAGDPGSDAFLHSLFGSIDLSTGQAMLQLAFAGLGCLVMCLVAATLVGAVASDERERRLDIVLSTPISRVRWMSATCAGVFGSIALFTLAAATVTAMGAAGGGQDGRDAFFGMWVGGLYAATLAGLGLGMLGLGRAGLAGPVTAALAVGFYAFDIFGSILRIPPELASLSLGHHLGLPMLGVYDLPGMLLMAALTVGGVVVGAWGMDGRDLSI
jgi:ABC-2 type transport system permease protein